MHLFHRRFNSGLAISFTCIALVSFVSVAYYIPNFFLHFDSWKIDRGIFRSLIGTIELSVQKIQINATDDHQRTLNSTQFVADNLTWTDSLNLEPGVLQLEGTDYARVE